MYGLLAINRNNNSIENACMTCLQSIGTISVSLFMAQFVVTHRLVVCCFPCAVAVAAAKEEENKIRLERKMVCIPMVEYYFSQNTHLQCNNACIVF